LLQEGGEITTLSAWEGRGHENGVFLKNVAARSWDGVGWCAFEGVDEVL